MCVGRGCTALGVVGDETRQQQRVVDSAPVAGTRRDRVRVRVRVQMQVGRDSDGRQAQETV
jgi:hypothetical protein